MKLTIKILISALVIALLMTSPLQAQNKRQLTATLLPIKEAGLLTADSENKGLLWIQNNPPREIFLQFDLSGLPDDLQNADFKQCILRLVARKVVYQPPDNPNTGKRDVSVKGWLVNDDFTGNGNTDSIISLSQIYDHDDEFNKVAKKTTEAFRQAVYREYSGDKKISLRLFSETDKSSSLFNSSQNSGIPANPSNLPRLVIKYTPQPPELLDTLSWSQHQQNPEHTGRNSWTPFQNPMGFSLSKIDMPEINRSAGTIASYPLIHQGNIYLVYKVLDKNYLFALDYKGNTLWQKDIGTGIVQSPPVISRNGIFYTVTEGRIGGYDLNRLGQMVASHPLPGKISGNSNLTVGYDGSLFGALKENDVNYIYGFTPDLKPFIRSDPLGAGKENISTVTVSPDGQNIFAQTPKGAAIIDIADPLISGVTKPTPNQIFKLENGDDRPWQYYHTPVAAPADGVMIFSDLPDEANAGNVWAYTLNERIWERIWNAAGTLVPQPVIGSNGLVFYIQDGALIGHHYNHRGAPEISAGTELNTTSNLVMDGADNIYFWDNGYLHGYGADGKPLFAKISMTSEVNEGNLDPNGNQVGGPEQFLRLMLGPDGTLWANNKNGNAIFAFKPHYAESNLILKQENLKTDTVYRATGRLAVAEAAEGFVTIGTGSRILFQAQNSITFPKGFAVKIGTSLLCRTGF